MTQLPVEVLQKIVKNNDLHKRDLCALSTTSSLFCSISQEALYDTVVFSTTYKLYQTGRQEITSSFPIELFMGTVSKRPDLAGLVRTLNISYDNSGLGLWTENATDNLILFGLPLFTALRVVAVTGFVLDPEFVAALQAHPRLNHIEFHKCHTFGDLDVEAWLRWSSASVSSVTFTHPRTWEIHALCPRGITSLKLAGDDPFIITKAFSNFVLLGVTGALTSLLVSTMIPPNFIDILTSCPQLRRLDLRWAPINENTPHFDTLSAEVIPLLEEFTGQAGFCGRIIQGRPVHSVTLSFQDDTPVDVLLDLQLSAVPITKVVFYSHGANVDNHHEFLMDAPTSIETFGWDYVVVMRDYVSYCTALSGLSRLAVLTGFPAWSDDLRTLRKRIVDEYSRACPSLKEVHFDFEPERWLAHKDGSWERYVRSIQQ